ncbi:flagellar biosynthesis anti-sigma factor FlgM [Limnohabitans sp. 2KL-51]|nr:flagellar biosynthesis anti-sigma factor FlgM [Limnohabitans sp. 2KL-51]
MDASNRQVSAKAQERDSDVASEGLTKVLAPQADEVKLSAVAQKAMQEPEFDRAKVEAIKEAIQKGQYPIDTRRIAENFLAIEKMIKE